MAHYRPAAKYFQYLITKVPSDPGALARLGQICAKDDDETQAFHYHHEVQAVFACKWREAGIFVFLARGEGVGGRFVRHYAFESLHTAVEASRALSLSLPA